MRRWIVAAVVLLAVVAAVGAGWRQMDRAEDAKYRRFCIESLTDQGRCDRGPAVEPRRKCERLTPEWPPGVTPNGDASDCVQAWLADK